MAKKIAAGYCLCVMVLFMISILLRAFTWNVLVEILHIDNAFTQTVMAEKQFLIGFNTTLQINWAQRYPFLKRDDVVRINRIDTFKSKVAALEKKIEQYTGEQLAGRVFFVESAVRLENALAWTLNENIVDLGDGFITELIKQKDAGPCADGLADLHNFLSALNIDLLYVQSPHKICKDDTISGINDFSNTNVDALLSVLSTRHIPYLDVRETLHQENLDHHSLFYKTDHHWKAETGLWASGVIAKYLNAHNGFSIDTALFSPDRYRYEVYEKWFLGSVGRKVTLINAEPEDCTFIYPKEETDLSFQILSRNIDTRGAFDVIYDYRQVEMKDYYTHVPYSAYTYADNALITMQNHKRFDGKRVLFIKDSFVNVVAPFFALGVEYVDVLDLRQFNGSVKNYIEQTKPDTVIVMYNPSAMTNETHNMFDFR
ncbi:MAG: hypothetical protein LBJ41_06430 [Treponema sp.]|jgi:hypothetical protein|nr:hypothetical protein [Treponema sp.]